MAVADDLWSFVVAVFFARQVYPIKTLRASIPEGYNEGAEFNGQPSIFFSFFGPFAVVDLMYIV